MKKKLVLIVSVIAVMLAGCNSSSSLPIDGGVTKPVTQSTTTVTSPSETTASSEQTTTATPKSSVSFVDSIKSGKVCGNNLNGIREGFQNDGITLHEEWEDLSKDINAFYGMDLHKTAYTMRDAGEGYNEFYVQKSNGEYISAAVGETKNTSIEEAEKSIPNGSNNCVFFVKNVKGKCKVFPIIVGSDDSGYTVVEPNLKILLSEDENFRLLRKGDGASKDPDAKDKRSTSIFMTNLKKGEISSDKLNDIIENIKAEGLPYYDLTTANVRNYGKDGLFSFGMVVKGELQECEQGYYVMTVEMEDSSYTMAIGRTSDTTIEQAKAYATQDNLVYYVAYVKEVDGINILFPIIAGHDLTGYKVVEPNLRILYNE